MQTIVIVLLAVFAIANCDTVCKEIKPIDLALLLDSSGSISRRDWPKVKEFAARVVNKLGDVSPNGSHVAVVTFSDYAKVNVKFNDNKINAQNIKTSIDALPHMKDYTYLDKALIKANNEVFTTQAGMREDNHKVAIVMTDGKQTVHKGPYTPLKDASRPLKDKGVNIFVIGVGLDLDLQELVDIATIPNNVYSASSFDDLVEKVGELQIRSFPCPTTPPTKPPPCKHTKLDVGIVLDESASVGKYDFPKAIKAIIKLAKKLKVSKDGSHVAMLRYGTTPNVDYKFEDTQTFDAFSQMLEAVRYGDQSSTYTSKALIKAGETFFKPGTEGNRPGVADIAIVFTDGNSDDKYEGATSEYMMMAKKTIAIGIGKKVDRNNLIKIARGEEKNTIRVTNFSQLGSKIEEIIGLTCKD